MNKIVKLLICASASLVLASCATPQYRHAEANIHDTQDQIHHADLSTQKSAPPVVIKSGYYVNTNPVSLKKTPKWLTRRVSLRADNLPLSILMNRLLSNTNMSAAFDSTVQPNQLVSLHYRGTVQGALKEIGSKLNYAYTVHGNTVDWSAFVTRTFNISFMPGSSNYLVGQTEGTTNNNLNNQLGGNVVSSGGLNDQQYSNLEGTLSVWNDLRRTLDELKSRDGSVSVSESTTTVTVHDHPSNVRAMAKYIASLNKNLSKEVGIKIQVLDVDLDEDYATGIDWNAVANIFNTQFRLRSSLGSAVNPLASNILTGGAASPLSSFEIGEGMTKTLIQALDRQGKVRVVTKPQVVTMNDQIASIRITQNTGYIESVSSTISDNFATTSITPGSVTDGFTLYILPRIKGKNVYMQISSSISNLLNIQKESTRPPDVNNNNNNNNNNNQDFSAIEVPTIAQKSFNQRSVVPTGHTLVIAGYKRLTDKTNSASLFGIGPLGGKGSQSQNIETLVLITPVIITNG